ncbi:wall-associated receptor kinase-like 8 isoform X2 [Spinacia oleracea]|uniref:Wall-associated receptor kinase-like 8 isoform X2 n=1 Tax=Spinacia oleracea TaxID=3562 RepID=A0ABM3QK86_SPIOL|nr:wall-associated receptor kinase-like 8 isoform X2 [Spinacia oleracea]
MEDAEEIIPRCISDKSAATNAFSQIALPNCPEKCGNITVPYPFGLGDECRYATPLQDGKYFNLTCNTSVDPPILELGNKLDPVAVEKINLKGELLIHYPISYRCYQSNSSVPSSEYRAWISSKKFPVSTTQNIIGAIGCDTFVTLNGTMNNKREFRSGCMTVCAALEDVDTRICSGIGCCLISVIPNGVTHLDLVFKSLSDQKLVRDFNPCSVAFVLAKDHAPNNVLPYSIKQILTQDHTNYRNLKFPVVFDWSIGNVNCETAQAAGDCLCKGNSKCHDNPHQEGYRCQCIPGFQGNPYLHDCQDIDECATGNLNSCKEPALCINTRGSYNCKCPRGYSGKGTMNNPCIPYLNGAHPDRYKLVVGLSVIMGSILIFLGGWWCYSFSKKRKVVKQKAKYFEKNGGLLLKQQMSPDDGVVERTKVFTINELEKATDHFNENRILGRGGHGTVYKGMLGEGKIVAVKKSKMLKESHIGVFINEVAILSQINHRNIVKLLGCCLETEVPLLVYEFIPNGTLFHHIHHPSEEFLITWRMRLQIASDSAGALAYLHSSSSIPIFHRDIKSSNILLDDKYRAKLSDFGTSKSVATDQTHVTTEVMGTFGYLDPGYFQSSQFTEKSDVYSFGVVLVELLTGQKAIRSIFEEDRSLTSWFLSHMEDSRLLDIIDSHILRKDLKGEFFTIANLAKRCLHSDGKKRPTMKVVLLEIETVLSLHLIVGTPEGLYYHDSSSLRSSYLDYGPSSSSADTSLLFSH